MSDTPSQISPDRVGRVSQIVTGALIAGVVAMGVVTWVTAKGDAPALPVVSLVAAGFSGITVVMRFVIPAIMVASQKGMLSGVAEQELPQKLAGLYQTKTIVGMALLEGAAFFNLVAYMVDKQVWSYGIVTALLVLMAVTFPSQGQFESWVENMKREL